MSRQTTTTTTAIPFLLILIFCCFHVNAFLPQLESSSSSSSLRNKFIMNLHYENSTGRVQLKKDSNSSYFYVDADFTNSEPSQSNDFVSDTVKMMVSIVAMDTLVATNCLGFSSYDCSRYNCTIKKGTTDIDYPTFTASGATWIINYIYLDYQYWMIDNSSSYLAGSCSTQDSVTGLGKDRYGVLGLGAGMNSEYNYWYPPVFSVLIDSNLTGGELLFMKDNNHFNQSSSPLHTFIVNDTWQIPTGSSDKIKISTSSIDLNDCSIMFDINSDAIGLPNDIYTTVLGYLIADHTVWCDGDNYRPYCYTTKKLEDLPDIILSVNSSEIIIPSKIYASEATSSGDKIYFYFNFKATSPVLTGHSYVTPSFKNSIILDAHFMSYYYTIFCGKDGPKKIYIYSTTDTPSQDPSYAKWIVLGAIIVIAVVGFWFWTQKKKATNKNRFTAATVNTTTDGYDTAKAPLVHNQQVISSFVPNDADVAAHTNYTAQPQERAKP